MDFTNINDPAGVAALLDTLRSSQAWTDLQNSQSYQQQQQSTPSNSTTPLATAAAPANVLPVPSSYAATRPAPSPSDALRSDPAPSVASLLSALQSSSPSSALPTPPLEHNYSPDPSGGTSIADDSMALEMKPSTTVPPKKMDPRFFSFQQSLPYLASLSEDPEFLDELRELKEEQERLERDLWQERLDFKNNQEARVKMAVNKAKMVGTMITEQEANTMRTKFQAELDYFDRRRVLAAWEGLITKQQVALGKLGVPTMFVSGSANDQERQKRVVQVLEGITKTEETEI